MTLDLSPTTPCVCLTVVVCPVVLVTGPDHHTVLATSVRLPWAPVGPGRGGPGVLPGVLPGVNSVCQTNPVVGALTETPGPGQLRFLISSLLLSDLRIVSRNCCSAAELISAR